MKIHKINDKEIKVVKNEGNKKLITIGKIANFSHICPFALVSEAANLEVRYIPRDKKIEILSYRKFFEGWSPKITIEEIADSVFDYLKEILNSEALEVRVFACDVRVTPWNVLISEGF